MLSAILRYLTDPSRLVSRLRVEADLIRFRRTFGRTLAAPIANARTRRVLIVGLHGFVPSAKMDALYAKALESRGFSPWVVVEPGTATVPYYRAMGIHNIVSFTKFMGEGPVAFREEARDIVEASGKAVDIVRCTHEGVHVGRHAMSLLMRRAHAGKVDIKDPVAREQLATLLAEAMAAVHASRRLLDEVAPDVVLFNERGYTPMGEMFDVALQRRLNVIQYVASHRDDAHIWKRYTTETHDQHPHALSEAGWRLVQDLPWDDSRDDALASELYGHYEAGTWFNFQRLQHGKRIKGRAEVEAQLGLDPRKKTAAIFAHIFWDATFFYGDSLFDDYEEWLTRTVAAACRNDSVNWIVKLHPVNTWRLEADGYKGELAESRALRREIGTLPAHVHLVGPDTDINTYSLFEAADYGLTVRGTVGIEMAAFGRPVLTAGTGRYSGLGFTFDFDSADDYLRAVENIHNLPALRSEQTVSARKYAYALLKLRPLPLVAFTPKYSTGPNTNHGLNGSPVLHVTSLAEFISSPDMSAFADWASNPRHLDYLSVRPLDPVPARPV